MTVEWGGENRPVGWLDRILGGGGDPTAPRSVNVLALSCAVLTVVALLAAVLLPWAHIPPSAAPSDYRLDLRDNGNLSIEDVGGGASLALYFGWLVLMIVIALTFVVSAERRRVLVVSGLATAVFLAIMEATITGRVINGSALYLGIPAETSPGPGLYLGFAAALLGAATLILAGWQQAARRVLVADELDDELEDPEFAPAPVDLTVTSVPHTQ